MSIFKFTKEHEWLTVSNTTVTVGITHHAQQALGDIVYVELPESGRRVKAGDAVATVESVKAASEVYTPISGVILETNRSIADNPSLVNGDPQGAGWFFKLQSTDQKEIDGLMTEQDYRAYLEGLS